MCQEGSLSIYIAIFFFLFYVLFKHFLYHRTADWLEKFKGIAQPNSLGGKIERLIIKPFIPNNIETFIVIYSVVWFLLTIQMAVTRYYEQRWVLEMLSQHAVLNFISWIFGCSTTDVQSVVYTNRLGGDDQPKKKQHNFLSVLNKKDDDSVVYQKEERQYFDEIDLLFTLHLTFGMLWLCAGFLQIWLAQTGWSRVREVRHKAHRIFGRLSVFCLIAHITMASYMVYSNPVKQSRWIQLMYGATILAAIERTYKGLKHGKLGRKGHTASINLHKAAMTRNYVWTTFGSGAIRLTSWLLWCVGKFFPFETRIKIDRGECQTHARLLGSTFIGEADNCLQPVFHNIVATWLLQNWIDWIFLSMLEQKGEAHPNSKMEIKIANQTLAFLLPLYLILLILFPGYEEKIVKITIVLTTIFGLPMVHEFIANTIRIDLTHLKGDANVESEARYSMDAEEKRQFDIVNGGNISRGGARRSQMAKLSRQDGTRRSSVFKRGLSSVAQQSSFALRSALVSFYGAHDDDYNFLNENTAGAYAKAA